MQKHRFYFRTFKERVGYCYMLIKTKKRTGKKTICILTAAVMSLSMGVFTGCGNSEADVETVQDNEELARSLAYDMSTIIVENHSEYNDDGTGSSQYISYSDYVDDKLYYIRNDYSYTEESSHDVYYLIVCDSEGNTLSSAELFESDYSYDSDNNTSSYINDMEVNSDGTVTYSLYTYTYDSNGGSYSETQENVIVDVSGNEISRVNVSDSDTTFSYSDDGSYVTDTATGDDGTIYNVYNDRIVVLDADGNELFTTGEIDTDSTWYNTIFFNNEGKAVVDLYDYSSVDGTGSHILREIDVESKAFGTEYDISKYSVWSYYDGSGDYYCYYSSSSGMWGLTVAEDGTLENHKVLNTLSLGIAGADSIAFASDGTMLISYTEWSDNGNTAYFYILKPKDVSEVADRKVITLASFFSPYHVTSDIAEFNRTNSEYVITCEIYSDENDTSDYDSALTAFNNSLTTGDIPDMVYINSSMPYDSYVKKGLFTDLYQFMDDDDSFSKDMIMPNVLTALEKNGKLYSLGSTFSVTTGAAKTKLVGENQHITITEANAALENMAEGATVFTDTTTASDFLSSMITYGSFVDYENGTCSFNSDEFKAALEQAKEYPTEIDWDSLYNENPYYWSDSQTAVRDDRQLIYTIGLYSLDDYRAVRDAYIGEDFTFVGIPAGEGEEGSNACLYMNYRIAITEKCSCKEGAWEFLKSTLEYDPYNDYSFPILISDFDDNLSKSVEESQTDNNTYYVGESEFRLQPVTTEEAEELKSYLLKVTKVYSEDSSILDIVNEEAAYYFDGTKTVDETVEIIQSRASLYLAEQS